MNIFLSLNLQDLIRLVTDNFEEMMRIRVGGVLIPVPKVPVENVIPAGLLALFGTLSLRGPIWTAVSFLLLVISLHLIYKKIRKKCSSFYFSFTLCSLIGAHLVS